MLYFLFLIYFFVLLPFLLNSSVSPFPVLGQLWTSQHLTGDIHVEQLAFWILRDSLRVQEIYGNLYAAGRVCRTINYIWVHSQVCIVVFHDTHGTLIETFSLLVNNPSLSILPNIPHYYRQKHWPELSLPQSSSFLKNSKIQKWPIACCCGSYGICQCCNGQPVSQPISKLFDPAAAVFNHFLCMLTVCLLAFCLRIIHKDFFKEEENRLTHINFLKRQAAISNSVLDQTSNLQTKYVFWDLSMLSQKLKN